MTCFVTLAVEARWTVSVEAENIEEAKKEAELDFMAAYLGGNLEVVDYRPVIVEDEDDIIWEA